MRNYVLLVLAILLALVVIAPVQAQGPTLPPGLYVTDLRVSPNPPVRGTSLTFSATFNNTATGDQNMRWVVFIYDVSNMSRAYGQTSNTMTTFAPGISDKQSLGSWALGLGGGCGSFTARVYWLDSNNVPVQFTKPDGTPFEKSLVVCAPNDITPPPPAPPVIAPTPAPAPIGPGVYIADLKVNPDPPTNNATLTFTGTFSNTASGDQNLPWLVYVYMASNKSVAYGQTSTIIGNFPPGASTRTALGSWSLGTGTACTDMVARVAVLDINNLPVFLRKTDGYPFEKAFTVCPPPDKSLARLPVYVTDLRISPDPPTNNAGVTFYPTFSNTDPQQQSFTWETYIFKAGSMTSSYGETSPTTTDLAGGMKKEFQSYGYWVMGSGSPCTPFVARVGVFDRNHNIIWLGTPDGKVFEKSFNVCPP